jgi:bifunctional non-homologous end joining protein LigD
MIPLRVGTGYRQARALCQTFANVVAEAHPRSVTVERTIAARGRRVYLDCDQNMRAKTIAAPYSARHSVFGGVSTPVTWDEVEQGGFRPDDFTVQTIFERLRAVGDIWKPVRAARGLDVTELYRRLRQP